MQSFKMQDSQSYIKIRNKMKNLFVNMESVATFAASFNSQGKRKPASTYIAGIFYALTYSFLVRILNDIRLLPPCGALMCPLPCEVKDNGKGQPFFLPKMPKNILQMAELVIQNSSGNDVTTSLIVAQVFGKEHNKVVRDIESLSCSSSFNAANFGVIEYTDSRGRTQKAYEMTKDGFSFLVMGYTGAKAGEFKERFINEFNRREAMLKDDDYILMRSQQILQKRIEAAEQRVKTLEADNAAKEETISIQAEQIRESAPKVKCYDAYISSNGTYTATQIAKEYGWGAETLNRKLRDMGVQYKQNGQWILYAKYDGRNYTKSIPRTFTRSDGSTGTQMQTVWTSKGREFIHSLF